MEIIKMSEARGYRAVPMVSVKDLLATITDAQKVALAKGGTLTVDWAALAAGDEVMFIRGDFSSPGLLHIKGNKLLFKNAAGVDIPIDEGIDIIYATRGKDSIFSENVKVEIERIWKATKGSGTEYGAVIDNQGKTIAELSGTKASLKGYDKGIMKGAVVIHSHPSTPESVSFSVGDIFGASDAAVKRMVVVTEKYLFEMYPKSGVWPSGVDLTTILVDYGSNWGILLKKIGFEEASHIIWEKLASKYDLVYSRYKR